MLVQLGALKIDTHPWLIHLHRLHLVDWLTDLHGEYVVILRIASIDYYIHPPRSVHPLPIPTVIATLCCQRNVWCVPLPRRQGLGAL